MSDWTKDAATLRIRNAQRQNDERLEMVMGWLHDASPFGMPSGRRRAVAAHLLTQPEMVSVDRRPVEPFPDSGLCECGQDAWQVIEVGIVRTTDAEFVPADEHGDRGWELHVYSQGLSEYSDDGDHSYIECRVCDARYAHPDGDQVQWS